jgi:hypothetical protein
LAWLNTYTKDDIKLQIINKYKPCPTGTPIFSLDESFSGDGLTVSDNCPNPVSRIKIKHGSINIRFFDKFCSKTAEYLHSWKV